jgi:hypothetical protein
MRKVDGLAPVGAEPSFSLFLGYWGLRTLYRSSNVAHPADWQRYSLSRHLGDAASAPARLDTSYRLMERSRLICLSRPENASRMNEWGGFAPASLSLSPGECVGLCAAIVHPPDGAGRQSFAPKTEEERTLTRPAR